MQTKIESAEIERVLARYLAISNQMVDIVLTAAVTVDQSRYEDAAKLVQSGRIVPRVTVQSGMVKITLVDALTDKDIGDIFSYWMPTPMPQGLLN